MRHRHVTLLFLFACGHGLAQDAGAPGSIACQRALEALGAREAAAARDRGARAALESARRQAAIACLGGRDTPASAPLRAAQPSATTAPLPARSPGTTPSTASPPVSPPVPRAAAPVIITACDATGCWASDGTRLQRAGPNLLGPKGLCTTSGSLLQCPP